MRRCGWRGGIRRRLGSRAARARVRRVYTNAHDLVALIIDRDLPPRVVIGTIIVVALIVVDRKALIPAGADIGVVIVSARAADVNEEIVIILKREFSGQGFGCGKLPAGLAVRQGDGAHLHRLFQPDGQFLPVSVIAQLQLVSLSVVSAERRGIGLRIHREPNRLTRLHIVRILLVGDLFDIDPQLIGCVRMDLTFLRRRLRQLRAQGHIVPIYFFRLAASGDPAGKRDHDHGGDHIKPPLLVNRFLRFLRSRAVCRDLWRRLRARLCLRAAGRAEIALKFCTAMTAFHFPVLLSVYLSVHAAMCRQSALPNKRWKTGRFSPPCARRIWLFPVNFGKSRKLPNR